MLWFRIFIAAAVTLVWLVGYTLAYLGRLPAPPTELSALMAIVLGWAFGGTLRDVFRRRNGNGNGKDSDRDP